MEKSERQKQDQDLRCQSGPSAKDSSSSVEETLQRIMVQTNNDCRFLTFTLTSSLHQQPLLMQWIKEVELVDSVDELRSSSSTRGISMPKYSMRGLLQPCSKSSIIPSSKGESVWRNKKGPESRTAFSEEGRLPT